MRAIIPDLISFNVSESALLGLGGGKTFSINLVTRGDASISITETLSIRLGLHADLSVNESSGWYVGNSKDISLDTLLGLGADGSVDLGPLGVGAWTSQEYEAGSVQWLGISGGLGFGSGGSVGVGHAQVITIHGVEMRYDF